MKKLLLALLFLGPVSVMAQQRMVIYQMMTRLFGNKNTTDAFYGSVEENGTGKFEDINDRALDSLKRLGLTHIWYTGIIAHASMTDYSRYGISPDDPDVVKGRAGSPYAIRDYYDVDPDLATRVPDRMAEFEALVKRTHAHHLNVIMDFIPNHVARTYHSLMQPAGSNGFGAKDETAMAFSARNDFYYLPGTSFQVPDGVNAGGDNFHSPLKDGYFKEIPAKATGNDVFKAKPSIDDWYETVKLNYGVDILNRHTKHFDPIPSVWPKMLDILLYWSAKGVDGFRCDMAEMVPVEFWNWAIGQVKAKYPHVIFIAEAYNPGIYEQYLTTGKFDYLYDKVGMYDAVKKLIRNEADGNVHILDSLNTHLSSGRMVRFLENHDEERIASKGFAQDPFYALPGMTVTATLSTGPVMIYFGQEVGEPAAGKEGFGGDDGRTTLFDYWGVPAHQAWMNGGKFDGAKLTDRQKTLRQYYVHLLQAVSSNPSLENGSYRYLPQSGFNRRQMAFLRYTKNDCVLVVANFDREKTIETHILLPSQLAAIHNHQKEFWIKDLLTDKRSKIRDIRKGIPVVVPPSGSVVLDLK